MDVETIELKLNRLYIVDKNKYKSECDNWKSKDYKIYRDSKGRHKVIEPQKDEHLYVDDLLTDLMNGDTNSFVSKLNNHR